MPEALLEGDRLVVAGLPMQSNGAGVHNALIHVTYLEDDLYHFIKFFNILNAVVS